MMSDENQQSVLENATAESPVVDDGQTALETQPAEEEDFSKLLAESEQPLEKKTFEKGMIVEGVIVQIGAEYAYVNIGAKAEASIPVSELLNPEDGKLSHVVGDTIKAKVVGFDESGIKLSRSMKAGNIALEEAFQTGGTVKATVKATNKGGFELDVMGQRAFCPLSQIQKGKVEDPNAFVGQTMEFKIIKFAKRGRDIVLSHTAIADEENKLKREEALAKIQVGSVVDGKVVSIQPYGAFVDVGGIEGLVHVSEISRQHINDPKDILSVGQEIKVYVISIGENKGKPRLSLSIKQLEKDPYDDVVASLEVGMHVKGIIVRNVEKIGSFVDLGGVEGLIHLSELTWDRRITNPDDVVKVGQEVEVAVIGINNEKRRISLSYKRLNSADPWKTINETYSVGQDVTGTVDSVTNFGVFVKIAPRVTALLPMSEITDEMKSLTEAAQGAELTARIISIDTDRKRMTLSTRPEGAAPVARKRPARHENTDDEAPREHRAPRGDRNSRREDSSYNEHATFGAFGDALASLKKRK